MTMRSMRIVFVIKAMSLSGGGAERVLAEVSSGLARRGHSVTIISRDPMGTTDYYAAPGVARVRQGHGQTSARGRAGEMVTWLAGLRHEVTALRPDIAIGFMHSSYLPLGAALLGTGIPALASEHTVFAHYRDRPIERLLLRATPHVTAGITIVSHQARASFPPPLRRKMIVVPNPVAIPTEPNLARSPDHQPLIIAVGRLDGAKDHATLIAAFAQVAARFPQWHLEIAGEGDQRSALLAQVKSLGLASRVRLLGPIASIREVYARADLFAMASRYESFGLATAEALAHGVPAIGFADCAGTNELIRDGINGILIDPAPDRSTSLAQGLAKLMGNAHLRAELAVNGPASVETFAPEFVVARWENILSDITQRRSIHT